MTERPNSDSVKDEDILKLIDTVEFGQIIVHREKGKTVLLEDRHIRKPKDFEGKSERPDPPPIPDPSLRSSDPLRRQGPPSGPDRIIRKGI